MSASRSTASARRTIASGASTAPTRPRSAGLRLLRDRGVKVGVRFTMTEDNAAELPALLDLVEREGFPKFYLSHLVYAGRGNKNRGDDADLGDDARRDGPGDRARLGLGARADATSRSSPATTMPTRSICCTGPSAKSPQQRRASARQARAMGRQFVRRQRRQHRQSRQRASRHDVVALQSRQREGAAVLGDLDRPVRPDHGRAQAQAARDRRALRGLRLLRRLRRQHARARHADHRRCLGGGSRAAISPTPRSASPAPTARVAVTPYRGARHEAPQLVELARRSRWRRCSWPCRRRRPSRTPRSCTPSIAPPATAPTGSAAQGPALLPENLGRLTGARAAAVIADGRAATQMPAFGQALDKAEIAALAAYIATPPAVVPAWGAARDRGEPA